MGLTIAPKLAAQSKKTGQPRFPISAENLPWLESDLLIIAAQTDELRDRLGEPSPNSIIYAFGVMKPALAAAAEEQRRGRDGACRLIGSAEFQDHRRMIAGALAFSGVTIDAGRADAVVECR